MGFFLLPKLALLLQRGLDEAKKRAADQAVLGEREKEAALLGGRQPLQETPPLDPGSNLEAAEQVLRNQPHLEAARANKVEVDSPAINALCSQISSLI